jgi:hypothetical protein
MNTTKFTSDNTALLLIDHQVGTMNSSKIFLWKKLKRKHWLWQKWQKF